MKIFFLLLAFSLSIFGSDLLNIHKKLVPMTLLQVKTIAKKSEKNMKIIIVVNENEILKAKELKDMFPSKIKKFSLTTKIVKESDITNLASLEFDAIYTFSLSKLSYKMINNISMARGVITFSNSYNGLLNSMLVFIDKKKKIKIYMNAHTMKFTKIPFNSRFLSIVEIVNE